jgi:hypothetical protein
MSMSHSTIRCDSLDPSGVPCGAEALVERVHYMYVTEQESSTGDLRRVLSEMHYEIRCPRCGPRTQVEKAEIE